MITFLRLSGLTVAAVWLGGTVLYVLALDPLFGGLPLHRLLGPAYATELGVLAAERFQLFQVVCASLALIHALAEWLYSGRPLDRRLMALLVVLLALGSAGRLWLAPKVRTLNLQTYRAPQGQVLRQPITPAQRQSQRSLAIWQGISVAFNLLSLAGIALLFFDKASPPGSGPRIFPRNRLRI